MQELLPYFERELGFLKDAGREFAERFPRLAAELGMTDQAGQDPHIRRLMEANALLTARIAKRLDDDFPELTEALLSALYPHFLRSLPPCTIVQFDTGATAVHGVVRLAPGTEMVAQGEQLPCRFRTTAEVVLAPVVLAAARFDPLIEPPPRLRLPQGATSKISLTFESTAAGEGLADAGLAGLPLFVDGDQSFCAALVDCLFMRVAAAYVEVQGSWQALDAVPLRPGGFGLDEALIPAGPGENPAFRLLTEYFGFPEKFNFIHLDFAAIAQRLPPGARRATIHFIITGMASDAAASRTLRALSPRSLLLSCAPAINLFRHSAPPVRITHTSSMYDVVASNTDAGSYEIYSIDSVQVIRTINGKQASTEFRPYYGLRHGEGMAARDRFWFTHRDETQAAIAPGHELKIGFVDIDFSPSADDGCIASIETTCSNRERACAMRFGAPGGDLKSEGDALGLPVRMLRKPTPPQRFAAGRALHWRLVTQLVLNQRSLASAGAFREALALYDIAQSATSQRQAAGVAGIDSAPATAWIRSRNGASLVHGTQIRLTLDEDAFAGSGLYTFARVVDHFFGLYVHVNSFTQLTVLSLQTGKELLRCAPRNGSLVLV